MGFKNKAILCFTALTLFCSGINVKMNAADNDMLSNSLVISEENNQTKKVPENVSRILQVLGLMDENEINSEGYVNRAYAAAVSLRFDQIADDGTASGQMYVDVSSESPYAYAIEVSSQSGYFFGTGNGKFEPEKNVTPAQMATVLLRVAGYPNDHISTSPEYGNLLRRVDNYENLTYYGLANMLYNFLDINVVKISGTSAYKKSDENVLNDCFDIHRFEGVVTENGVTGLWSESDLDKNKVVVSGQNENIVFDAGETDIPLMIGKYVEVYYRYDEKKHTSVCVYYNVTDDRNQVTEVDLYNISSDASTDSKLVYYDDNDRKYEIKYNKKTAILYNGIYYAGTESILSLINGKEGQITAIDNNDDNVADILCIDAYETFIVNSVVLSSNTVFLKGTTQALSLNEADYDQFSLKDENGNNVFIADLVEGLVLSIAKNSEGTDAKILKVLVSSEQINGTVTRTNVDDYDRNIIELDKMNAYTMLNSVEVPNIGQGVILSLNAFGKVAYISYSNAGEFAYGIITDVSYSSRTDSAKIKLITSKNKIETISVEDRLIVDKVVCKNMKDLCNKLAEQDTIKVGNYELPKGVFPVRYKMSANGTLDELDTCNMGPNENGNTLEFLTSGHNQMLKESVMGGSFAVTDSTPVFKISGTTSGGVIDEEFFKDTANTSMSNVKGLLSNKGTYTYAAFKVDKKNSLFADFLIVYSGMSTEHDDKLFVVEKITTVYDEASNQILKCLHGISNGSKKKIVVSEAFQEKFDEADLKCGDVIRYRTDSYNKLIMIEHLIAHDVDGMSLGNVNGVGSTTIDKFRTSYYSAQMIYGYVLDRVDNYINISVIPTSSQTDGKRSPTDMDNETVWVKIADTVPITVYNPSEGTGEKVLTATYDEILDYTYSGKKCSLVALHFRNEKLQDMVVLNDSSLYN